MPAENNRPRPVVRLCPDGGERASDGLDDGRPTLLRDGEVWTRVPKTRNTIMTLFGKVTYERHRYRRADSPSLVPVDEQLGLAMDYFTEPAGELAVLLYSQLPGRTCSDLCRRIGGMTLTESTLQRLARETVEKWDEASQDALDEIRDEEGIPEGAVGACVSLDGVMVPMREERNGSLTTSYREASCGTLTWFDHEGEALRTVAIGRMPEANKRALKAQLEDKLAHLAKAAPHISAIAIADGARTTGPFSRRSATTALSTTGMPASILPRPRTRSATRARCGTPATRRSCTTTSTASTR